jgi:large subunit ribosomal protein L5
VHKRITFRNIPSIEKVVVHAFAANASDDSAHLHVAGMALQTITNVRVITHKVKHPVVQWGLKKGKSTSCTAELTGEDMYHFLAKLVELVMPKVKDYKGVSWTSGDQTGNVTFGFEPEDVALFPEIEFNYDA